MAGYIFSVSKDGWNDFCTNNLSFGYFTPFTIEITENDMTPAKRKARNKILAATFGDFITMSPEDNVYFLSDRKIYGIGRLVSIGSDCKYDNYADASALLPNCCIDPEDYLTTADTRARWVCFFLPAPFLFRKGVDMDDVLKYRPAAFRSLRAFEGLSFIKIDDEENRALKEFISLKNEESYQDIEGSVFDFHDDVHSRIGQIDLNPYQMDISKALLDAENKEYVFSEMYIESLLLQVLSKSLSEETFGHWDYLTHQLIASPFKPLKYIDKIDIFGYRFSTHYGDSPQLITKYLLIEMKKGPINSEALEQTMQYVDWICSEYASGDYSKVEAYVVGNRAVRNLRDSISEYCQRSFISETHPVKSEKWADLQVVKYDFDNGVSFTLIEL